ncbi:MAG: hypothetical protein HY288_07055 [Planctomycetia bacterium]|nr:hypothetical protein [Planctomycetia bacterium]
MLTITNCTSADCAAVADLWNAKTQDENSCWSGTASVDADRIAEILANSNFVWNVARDDAAALVGFAAWWSTATSSNVNLFALASSTDESYYRLISALAQWGLTGGKEILNATVSAVTTPERLLWNDLGVVVWEPIGFEPLAEGQDPSQRVPTTLHGSCALASLASAVTVKLGA